MSKLSKENENTTTNAKTLWNDYKFIRILNRINLSSYYSNKTVISALDSYVYKSPKLTYITFFHIKYLVIYRENDD